MTRYPLSTHKRRDPSDDDSEGHTQKKTTKAAPKPQLGDLINRRLPVPLGREPRSEEERRAVFTSLVRLRVQRYTYKECAEKLGVSEKTIGNYIADPLFREIWSELITESKESGHLLIAEVVPDAIQKMYELMQTARSDFVQFKAAEAVLNYAGYNMPREEAHADSREGVTKFLQEMERRRLAQNTVVNVHVHQGSQDQSSPLPPSLDTSIVEALPSAEPSLSEELRHYLLPVQPGGKLPVEFLQQTSPAGLKKEKRGEYGSREEKESTTYEPEET